MVLLTSEELAAILRVDSETANRLLEEGKIQAFRIEGEWRIPEEALVNYLKFSLEAENRRTLKKALDDPEAWNRVMNQVPEILELIRGQDFAPGSLGAALRAGLERRRALESESNVLPFSTAERSEDE